MIIDNWEDLVKIVGTGTRLKHIEYNIHDSPPLFVSEGWDIPEKLEYNESENSLEVNMRVVEERGITEWKFTERIGFEDKINGIWKIILATEEDIETAKAVVKF